MSRTPITTEWFWVSQARNAFMAFSLYLFDNFDDQLEQGIPAELVQFPTLGAVYRLSSGDGSDLRFIVGAFAQICEGLHYAHTLRAPDGRATPVIHRDVSPQNLFLTTAGVAKVLDFGVSKILTEDRVTRSGVVKGKLTYMPPEQPADEIDKIETKYAVVATDIVTLIAGRIVQAAGGTAGAAPKVAPGGRAPGGPGGAPAGGDDGKSEPVHEVDEDGVVYYGEKRDLTPERVAFLRRVLLVVFATAVAAPRRTSTSRWR